MSANPNPGQYLKGKKISPFDGVPKSKYNKIHTVAMGQSAQISGSLESASGIVTATGTIGTVELQTSGSISLADLTAGEVYELGMRSVSVTAGIAYILIN